MSLFIQFHPLHTHDPPEKGIVLPSRRLQKDVCAASTTSETILPFTRSLNKLPSKGTWGSTFMSASLVLCNISSSCLASVPLEDAWEQIRDFGVADWASDLALQESVPGSTVGALRQVDVGHGAMVERLVSLNDYEHSMAWSTVSHPNNTNPFPGTYLNSMVHLSLKPVSMGGATFIKLSCTFSTDADHKERMEATFQRLYDSAVLNVQRWVCRPH